MTRDTLGSNVKNETDTGTFFNLLVNEIPANARTNQVRDGIENILNNRTNEIAGNINFTVKSHLPFLWIGPIGESGIKEEINAGRPVIILMQKNLGGWDHYIVAYGYQNIISPTNGKQYSGYSTHFGHSDDTPNRTNVWVNSSWCFSYVSMQVNHTHNYNVDTGNNIGNDKHELRCNECGHRTVKDLYNVSGNTITSARYPLSGSITVPSTINGMTITTIGQPNPTDSNLNPSSVGMTKSEYVA